MTLVEPGQTSLSQYICCMNHPWHMVRIWMRHCIIAYFRFVANVMHYDCRESVTEKLRRFGRSFLLSIESAVWRTGWCCYRQEFKKRESRWPSAVELQFGLVCFSHGPKKRSRPPGSLLIVLKRPYVHMHEQVRAHEFSLSCCWSLPMPHPYMACSLAALRAYWGAVSWFSRLNEAGAPQGGLGNRLEHTDTWMYYDWILSNALTELYTLN